MECYDTRQQNVAVSKEMILLLGEGALFPLTIIALAIMLRCEQQIPADFHYGLLCAQQRQDQGLQVVCPAMAASVRMGSSLRGHAYFLTVNCWIKALQERS